MSTTAAPVTATAPNSSRPAPGGPQTFNLFNPDAAAPSSARSGILTRRDSGAWCNSRDSPFAAVTNPAPASARSSLKTVANSPTYVSHAKSPFSKAPVQEKPPTPSRINEGSLSLKQDETPAPPPTLTRTPSKVNMESSNTEKPPAPRPYLANQQSTEEVQPPKRATPKANQQSVFQDRKPSLVPRRPSATSLQGPPDAPAPAPLAPRTTPTFVTSAESPLNHHVKELPAPKVQRRVSKINTTSEQSPFGSAQNSPTHHMVSAPQPSRPQPQANKPSKDSPFSAEPVKHKHTRVARANHPSQDSPFSKQAETSQPPMPRKNSLRAPPGGSQTFNIFQSE